MSANLTARILARACSAFPLAALLISSVPARADWGALNMPVGVTEISREVYDLHMLIFWICVLIGVVVFGAMFYSMYAHRKSIGAVPAQFHESTKVELAWTIVPFVILVVMAIPATRVLVAMENTAGTELTVKITGYQWKWHYDYVDDNVSFFSSLSTPREQIYDAAEKSEAYLLEVDNPLVLPVGVKVRLVTTSADVIHAWWVPDLGWKRDSIPGYVNDNWTLIEQEGTFRGQCTELCGKDHGFMPIVVEAVSKEKFQQWLSEQQAKQAARDGKTVADQKLQLADVVQQLAPALSGTEER